MKPQNNTELKVTLDNIDIDYFISSASFESRCLSLSTIVKDYDFEKVIIFGTVDFDKKIEENRLVMAQLFTKSRPEIVDLKISDPVASIINIINACSNLFEGTPKKLLLDITTFTHEGLLILFRFLYSAKRHEDQIIISYTGAKAYSCNVENTEEKWLTKGVKELRSIIGYPGYSDPSKKNHLIILFGFEKERTLKLIEEFDFELVSLGFGSKDDSINLEIQEINQKRHNEILCLNSNAQKFEVSLTNIQSAKDTILEYVANHSEYNNVIAPMNNKISTIGVGLAAMENRDIQLCYMQANIYNIEHYSDAAEEFFMSTI